MHNIYSYHAKFNPNIPKEFIKKYSCEGDLVLDPFCGSGTTLLEGLKLKRNVIGVDISPIGILCSKVKTAVYDKDIIAKLSHKVLDIKESNISIDSSFISSFIKATFLQSAPHVSNLGLMVSEASSSEHW